MKLYIPIGLVPFLVLSLGGCFAPERPGDLNCSAEGDCPSGMSCGSDNICRTDGEIDANTAIEGDGSVIDANALPDSRQLAVDAGIPIDATPVGCSGDGDCITPPDLCRLPGTCNMGTGICSFPDVQCAPNSTCLNNMCNPGTGQCESANANEGNICIAEVCDGFGACGGFDVGNVCDDTGTRSQDCTESICMSGGCIAGSRTEMMGCNITTTGTECLGGTSCDGFGACDGFDPGNSCDEDGTRSRECTDRNCAGGNCGATVRNETENCSRVTDGDVCSGGTTCGAYGACAYSNACDETGSQSRTCTDRTCANGGCSETTRTETVACTRNRDGDICGAGTTCGAFGACGGFNPPQCDTTGTQSRTCTDFTCGNDVCQGANRSDSTTCTRASQVGQTCGFTNTCEFGQNGFQELCCASNESCTDFCGVCEQF